MKSKENYIKYFTDNVDEFELPAYICQAIFNLNKLANMSEEERKALYKMLVDIEKLDPSIPYNKYYLNYFK